MADNIFITAFIGGGKSLCGVRFICNELASTERLISTSLPLFVSDHWQVVPKTKRFSLPGGLPSWWLPEAQTREIPAKTDSMELWAPGLATWCHYEIEKPVDLNKRLRILTHEEVPKFYLHLPNQDLPEITHNLPGRKPVLLPDLTARKDSGCLFAIDEIHIYFSARNYLESGPGVEMYQSQLRHLNDDMVMISQHLEKVDKNFRRNCTKTYELSNLGNQKLWAGVSIKERFNWKLYSGVPQRGDRPIEKGSFTLREKGMCYLYDTMAGVGVSGGMKADSPPRGRHWSTWLIIGLIFIAVAYFFPRMVMKGFGYGMGSMMSSIQSGVSHGFTPIAKKGTFTNTDQPQVLSQTKSRSADLVSPPALSQEDKTEVTCGGYCVVPPASLIAFLSDGIQLSSRDGSLRKVTRTGVYDQAGQFYPIRFSEPFYEPLPAPDLPKSAFISHGRSGPVSVSYVGTAYYRHGPPQSIYNGWNTSPQQQVQSVTQNQTAVANPGQLTGGGSYVP